MARFREGAGFDGWREAEVLRLGAAGASRAEIAAALDFSLAGLAAEAAASPTLAAALDRALAWWEAIPREALAAGVRFNFGPWEREMRRRFSRAGAPEADEDDDAREDGAAEAGDDDWVEDPTWGRLPKILIPCNGRTRLRPDGTCPCAAYHNEAYWRGRDGDGEEEEEAEAWDERDDEDDDEALRSPSSPGRNVSPARGGNVAIRAGGSDNGRATVTPPIGDASQRDGAPLSPEGGRASAPARE